MPAVTTLAFYRHEQTIDSFGVERPKSLLALRAACRKEVEQLLLSLRQLELQYLQPHETHEDYIRENLFTFKRVMMAAGVREMRKTFDLEHVVEAVNSLGQESVRYVDSAVKMRAVQSHVNDFLPESFATFSERLQKVLECLQTYCLSFYRGSAQRKPDKYLETPFRYEQTRHELANRLQKDIMGLTEKFFIYGSVGLSLSGLTFNVQQLGRRCGCAEIPLFLLFPESCERVREACRLIDDWLEKDKEYLENLGNDLVTMDAEKFGHQQQFQEEYTLLVQLRHRHAAISKRIAAYEESMPEFKARKKKISRRHHQALVDLKSCEYHMHRAKTVLGEVKKRPENFLDEEDLQKAKLESLLELKRQKTVFPRASKKVDLTESIVKNCELKERQYEEDKKAIIDLQFQIDKCSRRVAILQGKLDRITHYEKVIKHIHTLKMSPASMKKIYHNLEMDTKLQASISRERSLSPIPADIEEYSLGDPVEAACRVVARSIDQDWYRLYHQLPFHPPRGRVDLDADVDRINKRLVRGSRSELATEALRLWRRLHTRTNVDGLKEALRQLGRDDIERKVDRCLLKKMQMMRASQQESRSPSLPPIAAR